MTEEANPILESKKWLMECGYTADEARNLIGALQDKSKERLWELAPKWIEHCGEHKKYQSTLLDLAAKGFICVSADENGKWMYGLTERGIKAGEALREAEHEAAEFAEAERQIQTGGF